MSATPIPDEEIAGPGRRADPPTAPLDPRRWVALGVVAVAQLMVVLDASVVNIALPSAQRALDITDADRQWVVTAYTLPFGGPLLLGGRVADYAGRKRVFIMGLVGFAAASALGGAAVEQWMLFAARAAQGVFAALAAPAALALINVTFTLPHERARAFAVYGAVAGGGAAIGLVLGGILTQYASWRWCLLVNIPIALVTALAASRVVGESRALSKTRYDVPGALLVTAGLVSLVYGFTEAARPGVGWTATTTLVCLALGLVLLVGFVSVEVRSANPLLPLRVVLDGDRGGAFLSSVFVAAGMFALFLFLAYYLQVNLGYTPLRAGLAFLPFSVGVIITASVVSNLLPRTGARPLMVLGGVLGAVALLYLTTLQQDSSWLVAVMPALLAAGAGAALVFVPASSLALHGIDGDDGGVASALVNATQQIGGSLGIALLNTVYTGTLASSLAARTGGQGSASDLLASASLDGYHRAFLVGAFFLAAAALSAALLVRSSRSATKGSAVSQGA